MVYSTVKKYKNIFPSMKKYMMVKMILNNECQIVATPGHTSGHISLYFPNLDCVITGDAAVQENRELVIANPDFCLDIERAEKSLNRIKSLKAAQYYCYHGGKLTYKIMKTGLS